MFSLFENPEIDLIIQENEGQLFDRKGQRINFTHLADEIIGFANADGGVIAIGIESDKTITGVQDVSIKSAEIRKNTLMYIKPPISVEIKAVNCMNHKKENTNIILIEIPQGIDVHSNLKDEVFLRIGSENIKLNHEQTTLLLDDRGKSSFELTEAVGATIDDLSADEIETYKQAIKTPSILTEDLLIGRDLAKKINNEIKINIAGILLFGKNPERWVERARTRKLRYEGSSEKTGEEFN